jgi:hypothetical protein
MESAASSAAFACASPWRSTRAGTMT